MFSVGSTSKYSSFFFLLFPRRRPLACLAPGELAARWVSKRPEIPLTITVGNQKEPLGLDYLQGNKFGMAQERALPVEAFGPRRSMGVRLHKAFRLTPEERRFSYWQDDAAYLTTSLGIFTEDIERTNDTDLAVTGRVTAGRERDNTGLHVGVAMSYREGEFDRISPRPETRHGDRIPLARPDANTQGILGLEGIYQRGRFTLQSEIMGTDYAGRVDGHGYGAYVQGNWFLTQDSRSYNSRWGILAPHSPTGRYSVSLFARLSHARGDDDINGWNAFRALTLGTDFYYRRLRASLNLFYGDAREEINEQDEGGGFNLRFQYIF